jgi:15-cis-phytoene synthase/lycopene beta-cyclase
MDDPIDTDSALNNPSEDVQRQSKLDTLTAIRKHLEQAYQYPAQPNPNSNPDRILDSIPNMTPEERSAFHLFATIVPRLVPIYPFLELCAGYETDLQFVPSPTATDHSSFPLAKLVGKPDFALEEHLPIKTTSDLLKYADNVAGSIASAICYLSWSLLTIPDSSYEAARPVDSFVYAASVHLSPNTEHTRADLLPEMARRASIVSHAREMGRALQLVNISRDIAKDASIGRLYIPLSSFPTAKALLGILLPKGSSSSPTSSGDDGKSRYTEFNLPLLNIADDLRRRSEGTIELLPRTARGGTRAMVASYFEIAKEIRRRNGEVDERGIKVNKLKRLGAATRAMWLGL